MKTMFISLVIIALTVSSCDESIPVSKVARTVYVAGWEGNVAKYWKNGVASLAACRPLRMTALWYV